MPMPPPTSTKPWPGSRSSEKAPYGPFRYIVAPTATCGTVVPDQSPRLRTPNSILRSGASSADDAIEIG